MDAMSIAASGMVAATARLNAGAHNIANLGADDHVPVEAVQTSLATGGVSVDIHRPAALFAAPAGMSLDTNLAGQLADQMQALAAFKANLAVIQSAEEMMVSVLDATA